MLTTISKQLVFPNYAQIIFPWKKKRPIQLVLSLMQRRSRYGVGRLGMFYRAQLGDDSK